MVVRDEQGGVHAYYLEQVVPVVFNVKNYDLFHVDRWSREFRRNESEHRGHWMELGVNDPRPFESVRFLAPQLKDLETTEPVGRTDAKVVELRERALSALGVE